MIWTISFVKYKIKDLVFAYILQGKHKQIEIAERINSTEGRVSQFNDEAIKKGLIMENGKITEKGKEWLNNHTTVVEKSSFYRLL